MENIINILMRRDGISELEATNLVEDVRDQVLDAAMRGAYQECEDIFMDELGLEPEYLEYLLW